MSVGEMTCDRSFTTPRRATDPSRRSPMHSVSEPGPTKRISKRPDARGASSSRIHCAALRLCFAARLPMKTSRGALAHRPGVPGATRARRRWSRRRSPSGTPTRGRPGRAARAPHWRPRKRGSPVWLWRSCRPAGGRCLRACGPRRRRWPWRSSSVDVRAACLAATRGYDEVGERPSSPRMVRHGPVTRIVPRREAHRRSLTRRAAAAGCAQVDHPRR